MAKEFGDLLSESWKDYKKNFDFLLNSFFLFYFLPLLAITLFTYFYKPDLSSLSVNFSLNELLSILSPQFIISYIGLSLLFLLIYSYLILMVVGSAFFKEKVSFSKVFNSVRSFYLSFLGLIVLIVIMLVPLYALLIVPGIIFSIYWIFSLYFLYDDKKGIWESITSSKKLVEGRWWNVFGYFLLLFLVTFLISFVIILPLGIISIVFGTDSFIPQIIEVLGRFISTLITTPLTIYFFKNFYLELKKKN